MHRPTIKYFLFVVKSDKTVEHRPVLIARTIGGESVIVKGVSPGEIVVTDGQLKLRNGLPVEIKESLLSGPDIGNQKQGRVVSDKNAPLPSKTK